MLRREFLNTLVFAGGSLMGFRYNQEQPAVLILGDSVSIGYMPVVKELMKDSFEVFSPTQEDGQPENCQGTTNALQKIDGWLGDKKWDIIHFNFGLHDLKHVHPETGKNSFSPKDPQQAVPKIYKKNLEVLVERLKATGAMLIFATTTPYPTPVDGPFRMAGEAQVYNKIATRIMEKEDIIINDLYAFVKPRMQELMIPKNVDFLDYGNEVLGAEVARVIRETYMS